MTILQRLFGILLFKPDIYRNVALNENLTTESFIIVILVTSVNTLVPTLFQGFGMQTAFSFFVPILFGWLISSWLIAWTVNKFFKKQIPLVRILRARGYAHIYSLSNIILIFLGIGTSIYNCYLNCGSINRWLSHPKCSRILRDINYQIASHFGNNWDCHRNPTHVATKCHWILGINP